MSLRQRFHRFADKHLSGHLNLGTLTIYGANAMHWAWQLSTPWGHVTARPTTDGYAGLRPWYVHLSPDGTSYRRIWGAGPGLGPKRAA